MKEPHGIAIGDDGAIYVTDNGNRRILKFDKNGNLISKFGSKKELSSDMMAIAIDAKGNIYVVDNNKAMLKKVTLGIRQGPYFEVLEGLKEGDLVVIMGQQMLQDNAQVSVEIEEEMNPALPKNQN